MLEAELAYLAGIVDGEGTVRIVRHNNGTSQGFYNPQISVGNTSLPLIEWLQSRVQGNICEHRPLKSKLFWEWRLCGYTRCIPIAKAILSYSIVKKERLELLIEFSLNRDKGEGYFEMMKDLNLRGVIPSVESLESCKRETELPTSQR